MSEQSTQHHCFAYAIQLWYTSSPGEQTTTERFSADHHRKVLGNNHKDKQFNGRFQNVRTLLAGGPQCRPLSKLKCYHLQ